MVSNLNNVAYSIKHYIEVCEDILTAQAGTSQQTANFNPTTERLVRDTHGQWEKRAARKILEYSHISHIK